MTVLDQESQVVQLEEWNKYKPSGVVYECRVWVCPESELFGRCAIAGPRDRRRNRGRALECQSIPSVVARYWQRGHSLVPRYSTSETARRN